MGRIRGETTTLVSVRIPEDLKTKCELSAAEEGLSLNEWIRRAIQERNEGLLFKSYELLDAAEDRINIQNKEIAHLRQALEETNSTVQSRQDEINHISKLLKTTNINDFDSLISRIEAIERVFFENQSIARDSRTIINNKITILEERQNQQDRAIELLLSQNTNKQSD